LYILKPTIPKPCTEKWENMQDSPEGKFCEICSKNVVDFIEKTDDEIKHFISNADSKEICGRVLSRRSFDTLSITAGIILVLNTGMLNAQTVEKNQYKVEKMSNVKSTILFSGILLDGTIQKPINNAVVYFITLEKLFTTSTNEKGIFSMEIPNNFINKKNIIYVYLDEPNKTKVFETYESQYLEFSREDLINYKAHEIFPHRFTTIGAVVLLKDPPPNHYYFNGKSISKRKFEKLRKENPIYPSFILSEENAKIFSRKRIIDNLYLLYSN